MAYAELQALAARYPPAPAAALPPLVGEYRRRHDREILDLAASAAEVAVNDLMNLGLEPEINSQIGEAFALQYPNMNLEAIAGATEEQLQGWANGVKGKYFEILVAEKLNAGESIGDLRLEPGQVARLADSPNQPGWDLEILDREGVVAEQIQIKATESMSYVKEALEKYPDLRVITPQELADKAAAMDAVLSTDIADAGLESAVGGQLAELSEGAIADILGQSVEAGFDALPGLSAAVIGATEVGYVLLGRSTVEESLKRGGARLGRSTAYTVLGAALTAVDAGIISVPTVTALRIAEGRVRHRAAMAEHLAEKTQEILREL